MAKRIKLMADYECFPLWGQSDDLPINIDPQTLPLTSETVQELLNHSGWGFVQLFAALDQSKARAELVVQ